MRTALLSLATFVLLASGCSSRITGETPATCDAACNTLWSKAFGGSSPAQISAMVADDDGNVILAGQAWQGFDLGAGAMAAGLFVSKLDPAGKVLWSKGFAATHESFASMAVDASTGEITLSGSTQSATVDFGGGPLAADPGATSQSGMFVVRLDAQGNHVWSRRYNVTSSGENDSLGGGLLAIGAGGYAVVTTTFAGTIDVAGKIIEQGSQGPSFGALVIELDANGNLVFAEPFGGADANALLEISGVAVDADGDIVIGGSFFGSFKAGADVWTSKGSEDVLLMKLDPSGAVKWSRALGGAGQERSLDLALGADGSIYLPGFFSDGADLGKGTMTAPAAGLVPYLAVIDPDGATRAVTAFTQPEMAGGYALRVAVAPSGDATVVLDPSNSSPLMQIASVDRSGQILPGTRTFHAAPTMPAVGEGILYGALLGLDPAGHVLLAGELQGTADFGTGKLASDSDWQQIMFIAKLAPRE